MLHHPRRWLVLGLGGLLLLGACQERAAPAPVTREVTRVVRELVTAAPTPVEVTRLVRETVEVTAAPVTPAATATDAGAGVATTTVERTLIICLTNEPDSLYLYGADNVGPTALATQALRHAVYESLLTTLSYAYQAQGLVKLPDLADGDAVRVTVPVEAGMTVMDANGQLVTLTSGVTLRNAAGELVEFAGEPVEMAQLIVRFQLQAMQWSDGTPVTADDSVFSFEVAADPVTPVSKERIGRTASYAAEDDRTVVWTGVPGWNDPTYFTNVWLPLPRHQLGGLTALELLRAPEAGRRPLSSGPYVIEEWIPGQGVHFSRNEHYYRADEGLPRLSRIEVQFVPNSDQLVARLLSGQCDVATQDGLDITRAPLLQEAAAAGVLEPHFQLSTVFEHIDFGIEPSEPYAGSRPDWFDDRRVRQALTHCTDRERMVTELLSGLGAVAHAYVPQAHPLYPADLATWAYDVAEGQRLLDEARFRDLDGDGVREEAQSLQPMRLELLISSGSALRQRMALLFQENMLDCGVEVTIRQMPPPELFDPRGPIFGRRFELVAFPWISGLTPPCNLYTSRRIPTAATNGRGNNNPGWRNEAFDAACAAAQAAPWNTPDYVRHHQEALRLFAENLPVIPLFSFVNVAATRVGVQNFQLDPTQSSELWNIYELEIDR